MTSIWNYTENTRKHQEGTNTYYLGIDCGAHGGFALLENTEVKLARAFDPGEFLDLINELMRAQQATRCCLEKVSAMPGQGVTSMFSFGQSYGWLKGVLDLGEIAYQEIRPQQWKKEFGLNSDKAKSVDVCRQLFPKVDLLRTPKCRIPHDGIAESLLMAEYARRKL